MNAMRWVAVALLSAAGITAGSANAAVITQLSAPGSLTLVNDFETTVNNSVATFDSTAQLGLAGIWANGVTPSGIQGLVEREEDEPLAGVLSSAFKQVGIWFGNDDFNLLFNVTLEVFSGATSLGSVQVASNGNDDADQFIGLSSDTAFDRFEIFYQRPDAGLLSVYVDDLLLGDGNQVPEPGTLALLAFGLAGIGTLRRKTSSA